jgi:hypothetical protein
VVAWRTDWRLCGGRDLGGGVAREAAAWCCSGGAGGEATAWCCSSGASGVAEAWCGGAVLGLGVTQSGGGHGEDKVGGFWPRREVCWAHVSVAESVRGRALLLVEIFGLVQWGPCVIESICTIINSNTIMGY